MVEPSKKGRKKKSRDNPVGRPPKNKNKFAGGSVVSSQDKSGNSSSSSRIDKRKTKKVKPDSKSKDKPPVDIERQCGVALPNGGYCARSLTCKTHSMGAKRAVHGRSMPYDVLLAAYQKRNQVKMASLSTQQQLELDNEALMDEQPLNVEEEFEQVMAGVVRAYPVPLERKVVMPTNLRTKFFRMREMLIGSLTTVPPLPSISSSNSSEGSTTGGAQQQSVNAVMAATGAVLGRTIVFDSATGAQYARPPRVYVNPNAALIQQRQQQQAMLLKQRQLQLAMQQRAAAGNTPNGIPSSGSSGVPAQLQMAAVLAQRQAMAKAQTQL